MTVFRISVCLLFYAVRLAAEVSLQALPEFLRPDPFGGIVAADRSEPGAKRALALSGARGGYVSFHLVVNLPAAGEYTLALSSHEPGLEIDTFREWFHLLDAGKQYYPDALVPVRSRYHSRLPEPDNRIAGQTAQAFWIDIWIGNAAAPGPHRIEATLSSGQGQARLPIEVTVLRRSFPADDAVTVDHNSYGGSWIAEQYPSRSAGVGEDFFRSPEYFRLIHSYHRIFYEHRGVFHQLGYGHAGKVAPEFAPALEGSGRKKHIANWDLFDQHYGPLLDGSAFANTRRGARPIPFVYLPINPEWPASYLWWGEPGYETEFVNVVSEMERHFREKGWTHTRFELFFNHKKRYMGFPSDGDEVRFPKDNRTLAEFARLMKKALPADTPVQIIFRADVSWDMNQQFHDLAGVVKMWICADSILGWYPEAAQAVTKRGDIVWFYSGPPSIQKPSAAITRFPLQAWVWGINGYVHWLTVSAGADPWFHSDGGQTALVYPGEKFGLAEPLPSVRLKIQRNCLQDLAMLNAFTKTPTALRSAVLQRFNGTKVADWWTPKPAFADRPPQEWSGSALDEASKKTEDMFSKINAPAWDNVHRFVLQLAAEEK
jgi:hypothetical protein